MRFITLLQPIDKLPELTDKPTSYECYDKNIYDKYMLLTHLYRTNKYFHTNYRKIVNMVHPFEKIRTMITSKWIKNCKPIKITNAFMKLYEFMLWLDKEYDYFKQFTNKIDVFDIAGAPGMFILSLENYLTNYHSNISLNWQTCSLEGGTALKDEYSLYKNNPERYQPCDVINERDLLNIINKQTKYDMVLGDIGIYHENDYNHLQEELQLDIEWGQMVLGINLVKTGGIMILKMYSITSYQTMLLMDILTYYFDKVFITKPYTSRIFNAESYIVCMSKNTKPVDNIPLLRPGFKPYHSPNQTILSSFESSRNDIKLVMATNHINMLVFDNYALSLQPLLTTFSQLTAR